MITWPVDRHADAQIDEKLAALTATERATMAEAVPRGGRGYDGKVLSYALQGSLAPWYY